MSRSLLLAVVVSGFALALAGCPPAYPKCSSDAACKDHNEVCVQGQCQECAADQNCKAGFVCQQNKCTPKPATAAVATPAAEPEGSACKSDNDCTEKQLCIRSRCLNITADLPECGLVRVHFAFNSSDLNAEDRPGLDRMARCVRADHALHVTIEGNADERGTEEYNLQLSQRRAAAVERYLENLGASKAQLQSIGYGDERPVCREHDEACWAKNRRAGIKPQDSKSKK